MGDIRRRTFSCLVESTPAVFRSPAINLYSHDVMRLVRFYESLGFRETFRTPEEGAAVHAEVALDGVTIGIALVAALVADHDLHPDLGGRPVEIVLWTDDADGDYRRLTAEGAPSLSPPHFLADLRLAWVADPDGNPIRLAQRR
jgi:catechol 2,3-dioxygenase-like lactoylglutathione lyase family enzyme